MISRLALRQPVLYVFVLLAATTAVSFSLGTNPTVNLWSLRYLWSDSANDHTIERSSALTTSRPTQHTNGLVWQARAALRHGEPLRAAQLLAPVLATGNRDAQRLQAEIFYVQREYEQAFQLWYQLAEVNSLLIAGREAVLAKDERRAQMAYDYAYQLDADQTARPLAQLLWREQRESDKALELLHQHVVTQPWSRYYFDWLSEMGAIYVAEGKAAEATSIYQQLLALAPDRHQDWIALGWIYDEQGAGIDVALAQFEHAIATDPGEGEGYFAKAELLEKYNLYREAELWYTQAIEREPEKVWWYLARANAVQKSGDAARALAFYTDVQTRFPESAQAQYQAADAYRAADDGERALSAIERALALVDSDSTATEQTKLNFLLRAGRLYEWNGKIYKALAMYQQALRIAPGNREATEGLTRLQ